MKVHFVLCCSIILFSCSNSTVSNEKEQTKNENGQTIEKVFNPIEETRYEQLIGIWEIKELRTDPNVAGKDPGRMDVGILFSFNKDSMFSTTSLGLEYLKRTRDNLGAKVTLNKGELFPTTHPAIFEAQWGKSIDVLMINESELVLRYAGVGAIGAEKNEFRYFKRIE